MDSGCVLCSLCSGYLKDSKDVYTIIKCGHIYHGKCLRKIIFKRICTVCHTLYDERQCRRLNLYSAANVQHENGFYPWEYDWMYCDYKTTLSQQELSKSFLKMETNSKDYDIYAARVFLNGNILPAYYVPARKWAITTFGGRVYQLKEDIDLLDISSDDRRLYKWEQYKNDTIPENAFDVTNCSSGLMSSDEEEQQYIARGVYKGKLLYGKLSSTDNRQNNNVYLAYGNEEIEFNVNDNQRCEVLVRYP